jgi:superoxide dismutase, Fe-Mn family
MPSQRYRHAVGRVAATMGDRLMRQRIAPLPCRPWSLNGLSERLIVSHYENNYGNAVRSLNAIRDQLGALDLAAAPGYLVRALKREELVAMGSVALHELYFGNLGGDGKLTAPAAAVLEEQFGAVEAWRREFVASAQAMRGGSGWALLSWSRRDGRLHNQVAADHSQALVDATPVLALDMYEHAYHIDFGANANAYVDAVLRNIDWSVVAERIAAARGDGTHVRANTADDPLPSVSIEELAAELAKSQRIQVLDARPKHYFSRSADLMQGATWRDPNRVDECGWAQPWSDAICAPPA